MKFGVIFANTGPAVQPEGAIALARAAEDAGFDSLWTVEHVVVPAGYESAYPYSTNGRMPGTEQAPIPDPLIWLTYVAAATTTIKLATGILILPQRNPVILAKETATLDVLSGGRVILGIGIGWLAEEFAAIGVPFDERVARTEEHVAALRSLWTDEQATFAGDFTRFESAQMFPKPVQPNGIPIVVGGHTRASARRAGRIGDGYWPATTTPDALAPLLDDMRTAAKDAGRNADTIEVTAGGALHAEGVKPFADLGVARIVVPGLGRDLDGIITSLRRFSDTVIAKL